MSLNGITLESDHSSKRKRWIRKVSREERSFDVFRLIEEVKIRPAIYDTTSEVYCDKKAKINAWEEVCEIMIPKWNSLSDEEKNSEEKILKGKWRNIRDYFMKEVKMPEQDKKYGRHDRKRKNSAYFEKLLFLLPNIENSTRRKPRVIKSEPLENVKIIRRQSPRRILPKPEIEMKNIEIQEEDEEEYITEDITDNASTQVLYKFVTAEKMPTSVYEKSVSSALEDSTNLKITENSQKQSTSEEDDFDRMFLLSLLPSLRKIPEENQLEVRIQMQQVIADALRNMPLQT